MSSVDACLGNEAEMYGGSPTGGMMEFGMGMSDVGQGGMLLSPHSDTADGYGSPPTSPTGVPSHLLPAAPAVNGAGMMEFAVQQPTGSFGKGDPSVESLRRQMDTSLTHNSF